MPIIDTATAAYATGLTQRRIQQLVKTGTITNHGTARRVLVDLDETLTKAQDPHGLTTR